MCPSDTETHVAISY